MKPTFVWYPEGLHLRYMGLFHSEWDLFSDKNAKIKQSLYNFCVVFATGSQLKSSHKGTTNGSAARQNGAEPRV